MKKKFYTELAYIIGLIILAFGTTLMEKADFGMSMVVAPAYVIYLKVSQYLEWFTFGMSEYCLQAILIVIICLVVRRVKIGYLGSFLTALLYGTILDVVMKLVGIIDISGMLYRICFFCIGMFACATGVSLLFHTYLSPEAYELFVKEYADKYGKEISKVKTVYDCSSCVLAIILSFIFMGFGHFEGVKIGTVITAIVNGFIIGKCSSFFEKHFNFVDALSRKSRGNA